MVFLAFFRNLSARHTALKEHIHAFRIPLPPMGQKVMMLIYSSIPVIGGYYIMQWAQERAVVNLGKHGENMRNTESIDQHRQASTMILKAILEKNDKS